MKQAVKTILICGLMLLFVSISFMSFSSSAENQSKAEFEEVRIINDRVDFGTFEYGEDELSMHISTAGEKTPIWIFYGDGELLERSETDYATFDWSEHGDFDKREFRIEVERYSDVTKLDWSYKDLVGDIPPEVGKLSNLERLYMRDNELSGEIPAELGKLTDLEYLELRENDLMGTVPKELGKLSNLERLYLSDNQLSGEIPPELGELSNVKSFYLHLNSLDGNIPSQLGDLSNLRYLDLRSNELSGEIPPELGELSNLQWLKLCSNQLSGDIPSEFDGLSSLEWLHLSENKLSGEIPVGLGDLLCLEQIYLDGNELSGKIPAELNDLDKLEHLDLGSNRLSGEIPPELGELSNLRWLNLHANELSGKIPYELSSLIELERVKLQENNLEDYEKGAFSTQPDLGRLTDIFDTINISDNDLASEDIDLVLSDLVESLDLEGRVKAEVYLNGNSEPSSWGIEYKRNLEDGGWKVEVDGTEETEDEKKNDGIPGFTSSLLLIALVLTATLYRTSFTRSRNQR